MAERRSLASAVNQYAGADPEQVRAFITQEAKSATSPAKKEQAETAAAEWDRESHANSRRPATSSSTQRSVKSKPTRLQPVGLIPVTIRMRPEIAGALKRASLERQLSGEDLFTQQEIVESALEPWLEGEGYL
jgi:hypothetical protein